MGRRGGKVGSGKAALHEVCRERRGTGGCVKDGIAWPHRISSGTTWGRDKQAC